MPHYAPSSTSAKKVYIAQRRFGKAEGTPVTIGSGGEGVQFVDNPGLADETVVVHIDGRPVDRRAAITLTKAALKEQKRQAKDKKELNVVDQIVTDLSAPRQAAPPKKSGSRFAWGRWALIGCVGWIVLVIAAGVPLAVLATPIAGPLLGWMGAGMLAIVFSDRW